ncbi:MAG: POTRA domain-containing protein [Candidatus Binataceae bacterium]
MNCLNRLPHGSARVRFARYFLVVAALCASAMLLSNAAAKSDTLRLAKVSFVGLSRYTEAQASAAAGLHVGDQVTTAQLKTSADLLAASGAFDSVAYRYSTQGGDLDAEYEVTETKSLLSCRFDNFIWFSPEQLDQTLRRRVPLYTGFVPERGTLPKQVSDALQTLATDNGIHGTVEYIAFSESIGVRVSALIFRVSGVAMPVRTLSFPGASALSEKELAAAAPDLTGRDYSANDAEAASSAGLLPLYHRRGYLQAHFDHPQASIIAGTSSDVAVAFPVTEGPQYSWSKADWTGNHAFSPDDLAKLLDMKPGEVANLDKIDAGFTAVTKAYQGKGYIEAKVQPTESLDSGSRQASFQVALDEGNQYHMGQLRFQGVPDKLAAELAKKWNIKSGQVYDGNYSQDFLKKEVLPKLAEMMRTTGGRIGLRVTRDPANATVDVLISFQ